jgi:plasmid maintenance system antidote protein VapI
MSEIEKLQAEIYELAKAVSIQQQTIELLISAQKKLLEVVRKLAQRHGQ